MNKMYNNLTMKNITKTDWFNQFDKAQQEEIRLGLEDNLNVLIYANPEFDDWQMKQIRLGLADNLDVSSYAKKELDWDEMKKIRKELLKESTL